MSAGRRVVGIVGELLITAGVLLLLFVVWELGFVAVVDGRAQAGVVEQLEQDFAALTAGPSPSATPTAPGPPGAPAGPTLQDGKVFAILRVPRLGGPTWAKPIYEGVAASTLAKGLGRYPQGALPGQTGNFAVAGHRAGHGNPLTDIDAIRAGDVMVVETRQGYAVYRADRHIIVPPTGVDVLAPVPQRPGAVPTAAYLTLTSCDPRFASTNRYVVVGRLERVVPRGQPLPAELLADPSGAS